ncbi:TetR/AcrR family transcriptional regulator [Oceanobacillus profundus]|uniref:TetR/AcrR family transcriptional regulator n=1 Tax=Oceanobacillus TaxID=182709 RepID=UPI0026E2204F|nr:TetR/AcrR family transcriptional regulator [Oceanobacillus profundus]MDO6448894.1 TetR/AcrR family transcriptional regulator [Oceanobacillus profundus]
MSERTKQHIQQGFYTLLKIRHFSDITVQDICDQTLIHRSTFYRYYSDKYVLLNTLVESVTKELYDKLPFSEAKTTIVTYVIDYIDSNMSLL